MNTNPIQHTSSTNNHFRAAATAVHNCFTGNFQSLTRNSTVTSNRPGFKATVGVFFAKITGADKQEELVLRLLAIVQSNPSPTEEINTMTRALNPKTALRLLEELTKIQITTGNQTKFTTLAKAAYQKASNMQPLANLTFTQKLERWVRKAAPFLGIAIVTGAVAGVIAYGATEAEQIHDVDVLKRANYSATEIYQAQHTQYLTVNGEGILTNEDQAAYIGLSTVGVGLMTGGVSVLAALNPNAARMQKVHALKITIDAKIAAFQAQQNATDTSNISCTSSIS